MSDTTNWLVHDHRKYEAALKACEIAAGAEDWKDAARLFREFVDDLKLHMRMEDEVLYPFFKEEVGDPDDEIGRLSDEHDDIVRLLYDLDAVIRQKDFDHFEESLQPLYRAMVEHNAHEEAVFGRLGEGSLLTRRDEILRRLEALEQKAARRIWPF